MTRQEKVEVEHGGRTYRGHYLISDGAVSVSSAYGSKGVKLKPNDEPAAVASRLMLEIVKAWRT